MAKEDLDVTMDKGTLRISVERKAPEGEREFCLKERSYGPLERQFSLSDQLDPQSIEAELREGILHVKIAKRPEAQPRQIDVKVQ